MPKRILTPEAAIAVLGLKSASSIDYGLARGTFPEPDYITSGGTRAWDEDTILTHKARRERGEVRSRIREAIRA